MTLFGPDPSAQPNHGDTEQHKPQWTTVGGRTRCDQCVLNRARDAAAPMMPARLRRVGDGADMRLCYEHAQPVRARDERASDAAKV